MIDSEVSWTNEGFSSGSIFYIKEKMEQWKKESGSISKHVGILGGRNKLKLEFFENFTASLQPVCRDINRLGYARSREEILKIIDDGKSRIVVIPFLGTVDVILGGLSDACGFRKQGDKLDRW